MRWHHRRRHPIFRSVACCGRWLKEIIHRLVNPRRSLPGHIARHPGRPALELDALLPMADPHQGDVLVASDGGSGGDSWVTAASLF
jgi:hypothetical protein